MWKFLQLLILILVLISPASALPKYAKETGQKCTACHTNPATGELNDVGRAFQLTHKWPPGNVVDAKYLFLAGFVHIFSVVLWIGAIFFVHLVHSPDVVAMGGAPRKELVLGWIGIAGTGISGVMLATLKFHSLSSMLESDTGKIVLFKVAIYLFMVSTALTLTFYLNRKFRMSNVLPLDSNLSELEKIESLERSSRVLVSVGGLVFDLTDSPLWKEGKHAGKHEAWTDLTDEIKQSPHGIGVLRNFRPVGYTSEFGEVVRGVRRAVKIFRFFAYANLFLGVTAIALSSYMRWML